MFDGVCQVCQVCQNAPGAPSVLRTCACQVCQVCQVCQECANCARGVPIVPSVSMVPIVPSDPSVPSVQIVPTVPSVPNAPSAPSAPLDSLEYAAAAVFFLIQLEHARLGPHPAWLIATGAHGSSYVRTHPHRTTQGNVVIRARKQAVRGSMIWQYGTYIYVQQNCNLECNRTAI